MAAWRDLGDGRIGIWTEFRFKDQVKQLPGARWDPDLKCWTVPRHFRVEAETFVNILNGADYVREERTNAPPPRNGTPPRNLTDAFALILRTLGPDLATKFYRSTSKVLHPDTGGDENHMKALTHAREKTE